jgi:hypothetical protein
MAERERPTHAAGSPEEQPLFPGQEVDEQPRFTEQEAEAGRSSPQDVLGTPGPAEAHDPDRTATHERAATAADAPTSVGDAGLIGG